MSFFTDSQRELLASKSRNPKPKYDGFLKPSPTKNKNTVPTNSITSNAGASKSKLVAYIMGGDPKKVPRFRVGEERVSLDFVKKPADKPKFKITPPNSKPTSPQKQKQKETPPKKPRASTPEKSVIQHLRSAHLNQKKKEEEEIFSFPPTVRPKLSFNLKLSREVPNEEDTDEFLSLPWNRLDHSSTNKRKRFSEGEESDSHLQDAGRDRNSCRSSDLQHDSEEHDNPTALSFSSIMCSSTPEILASQTQQQSPGEEPSPSAIPSPQDTPAIQDSPCAINSQFRYTNTQPTQKPQISQKLAPLSPLPSAQCVDTQTIQNSPFVVRSQTNFETQLSPSLGNSHSPPLSTETKRQESPRVTIHDSPFEYISPNSQEESLQLTQRPAAPTEIL